MQCCSRPIHARISSREQSASCAQPLTSRIEGLPIVDEHALVDDNRYVADVLADFRLGRAGREYAASKLLFKKRMFRETDESILEPVFISLSYVQAQYDYLQVRNPKLPRHKLLQHSTIFVNSCRVSSASMWIDWQRECGKPAPRCDTRVSAYAALSYGEVISVPRMMAMLTHRFVAGHVSGGAGGRGADGGTPDAGGARAGAGGGSGGLRGFAREGLHQTGTCSRRTSLSIAPLTPIAFKVNRKALGRHTNVFPKAINKAAHVRSLCCSVGRNHAR